ncbi:hypothetical protein [Ekhidna sp.]|uniref:hypothetical protein n=1 Tax=Ekhidna sp. TaxID=2608089 RepID=UPI003512F332
MNKTELITFLRDPSKLSSSQLEELEEIVDDNPYFLSARLLLAKAGKEHKHPKTKKFVASAAIYSTDRILLKKYLNGNLFFLSEPPKAKAEEQVQPKTQELSKVDIKDKSVSTAPIQPTPEPKPAEKEDKPVQQEEIKPAQKKAAPEEVAEEKPARREDKRPSAIKEKETKPQPEVPDLPSGDLDSILEELERDMENLKASREKFAKVQEKIEEDDAVSAALQKASDKTTEALNETIAEVRPTSEPPPLPTIKEEETKTDGIDEEVKKSSEEITRQVLEAAKKAKEEVAKEDSEAKAKAEPEEKKEEKPEKSQEKPDDNERAERVIREPRFSRFSTRSYIKPPEDIDTSKFLDDEKKEEKPSKSEASAKEGNEEDDKGKIKLPDLSKAKPVERRSKKKTSAKKEEDSEDKTTERKADSTKAKEKSTTKKKATKTAEKKPVEKKATPKKKATAKKETAKKTSKEKTTAKSKTKKSEEKKDDDSSGRKSQQEIIDKFIKEAPSIKYQRKEDMSAEDLAEKSAVWDPNLASEYLAEIYLHQGNKKRAIEIYEALSLKYPEKKSYFADLISKIE